MVALSGIYKEEPSNRDARKAHNLGQPPLTPAAARPKLNMLQPESRKPSSHHSHPSHSSDPIA